MVGWEERAAISSASPSAANREGLGSGPEDWNRMIQGAGAWTQAGRGSFFPPPTILRRAHRPAGWLVQSLARLALIKERVETVNPRGSDGFRPRLVSTTNGDACLTGRTSQSMACYCAGQSGAPAGH